MTKYNVYPLANPSRSVSAISFPIAPLLVLAMTSFIATANEIVPAGLLAQIAQSFTVSQAWAGQLVSACALGSAMAAIPLTVAFRHWQRKNVLMLALLTFFICNVVTAVSPYYALTLAARFLAGLATGLAWSLLASYARSMVVASLQGRALAVAMLGIPIALSLGVPLSAWIGKIIDWHAIFGGLAGLTLVVMLWAARIMPDPHGQEKGQKKQQKISLYAVVKTPGVGPVLFVVMTWNLAHYMLFTYIAPFLEFVGLANYLDLMLLIFGVSTMVGLWIVGLLIDKWLRGLVLLSLCLFALVALIFGLSGSTPHVVLVCLGVSAWGLSFGGAPTLLQTALAEAATDATDVAQSMLVTVFNFAFAASGVVGGLILGFSGVAVLPWVTLLILLAAFMTAWRAKAHGFTQRH